jgi:diketogulonate reductase-like aldo/keto reductase
MCDLVRQLVSGRVAQNLDVFGCALTADDIAPIDRLDTGVRGRPNHDEIDFGPSIGRSPN